MRTVRVRYRKTGIARFVSHLDLVRTFSRAIRRAGINVYYSEGFNPHIKMTFLPPLSLGYESVCEAFDVKVLDDMPGERIKELLCATLPEELGIIDVYEPRDELGAIAAAEYEVNIGTDASAAVPLLSRKGLVTEKKTKKGISEVDVSDYIMSASAEGNILRLVLPVSENSINPRLVVEVLNRYGSFGIGEFTVLRKCLFVASGEEFR